MDETILGQTILPHSWTSTGGLQEKKLHRKDLKRSSMNPNSKVKSIVKNNNPKVKTH